MSTPPPHVESGIITIVKQISPDPSPVIQHVEQAFDNLINSTNRFLGDCLENRYFFHVDE